jgi:P4 family phage/plasmid primase-like protien
MCKASVAAGAERFARADRAHATESSDWDRDDMLLGTPAGTVDLRTGLVTPADPADLITRQTSVAVHGGEPTLWLRFLEEALAGDRETIRFLQQWAGYCLTGDTREHALAFVFGPGGNGKSVFLNTLVAIIGDYAATAAMEAFTASRSDRHSTELAMLRGARLVTASETEEGRAWAEARIKQMTGGDQITARFMRQDNFTFRPQFKLTIAGNHAPALRTVDDAMRRRFNIIPFVTTPTNPDRLLEQKLKDEHGRILAWAIAGCLDWQANGLVRPQAVCAATADYFENEDLFGQWLSERCELGTGLWELPARLYSSWSEYCRAAGDAPGTQRSLSGQLKRRGFMNAKSNGLRIYRGLSLKAEGAHGG